MSDCQYTVCNNTVVVLMFRSTTGSSLKAVLYSVTCISFLISDLYMKVMCTDRYTFNGLFFQDNPAKLVPESYVI